MAGVVATQVQQLSGLGDARFAPQRRTGVWHVPEYAPLSFTSVHLLCNNVKLPSEVVPDPLRPTAVTGQLFVMLSVTHRCEGRLIHITID